MRRKAIAIMLGCLVLCSFPAAGAETEIPVVPETTDAKTYGVYPIAYKEIVAKWMEERLVDPASAVYEWSDEPRAGEITPPKGKKVVGYIVDFKVNARNQFGAATGKQKYQVVIRNGEILWGGRPRP